MSSPELEDSDVPDGKTCEERCQMFAEITGTDTALAQFYLQDRSWNLEQSVNAYFVQNDGAAAACFTASADSSTRAKPTQNDPAQVNKQSQAASASSNPSDNPKRVRIMSWNIDGLDQNNVKNRTLGVCDTILEENPDVVYLQEVIPQTVEILEDKCALYQLIPAGNEGYFSAMMLKVGVVAYKEHMVVPFFSSLMSRNLLKVRAEVRGVKCLLITTHLESTKSYAEERKKQLKAALKEMTDCPQDTTVILGGDLNMRDKEVAEIGGLPESVLDVWEITGKRPEAKFTWDIMRNDNLNWEATFKPRCRFDRFFLKHSAVKRLKPVYFELVGIQRLKTCKRFASDHWGILSHYNIT